jgi:ABC-2 type transport system ATP-binding protein
MLTISNISKTYKNQVKALDNINLEIQKGMFGLLGPNGAGKSSLMRTIATLQTPDSGQIMLDNIDAIKDPILLKSVLGYLPQDFGFYPGMNALQILDYFFILKGYNSSKEIKSSSYELLEKVNLISKAKVDVNTFSGGMKQRLGIAVALIGNPKLVIVDEPTAGLDPVERGRFLDILSDISKDAVVILSTHIVDDINEVCTDMAIIKSGKVILHQSPQEAILQIKSKIWKREIDEKTQIPKNMDLVVLTTKRFAGLNFEYIYSPEVPDTQIWQPVEADLQFFYLLNINK